MPINTHCEADSLIGLWNDIGKIVCRNVGGPSTLTVAAEASDNRRTGRDEITSIGTASMVEVLAADEVAMYVSKMKVVPMQFPKNSGLDLPTIKGEAT